jgi:hypothetical protein
MTSVPRKLWFAVLVVMMLATNAVWAQFGVTPEREVRDESDLGLSMERRGISDGATGERPHDRGLRESIVGDAVKNALADVIRDKYGDGESRRSSPVTPAESTAPSAATKEFSYTSIRFKSSDSTEATTARNGDFRDSPLLQSYMAEAEVEQRQQEVEQERGLQSGTQDTQHALTIDTSDLESQLNAKLAAIQQEMSELEDLKRAIGQLEGTGTSTRKLQMLNDKFDFAPMPPMPKPFADKHARSAMARAKSKVQATYPDTGIPGWDPLALLDKHSAYAEDDLATLVRNSQEKAARLNVLMTETLAMGADSIATVVGKGGDRQVVRNDLVRSFLDALALEGQEKIGRLQEFFMQLMDKKQERVESLLDKIY